MDTQHPSAPPCAQPRIPHQLAQPHSRGITHVTVRHTARFTVIGNHLAQHPQLSGLAIGLGVHIQSLPTGARVDIRTLADRFPEGETRIASALRELETHGYLARTRHRLPSGHLVTRTVSYNQPGATAVTVQKPRPTPPPRPAPAPTPAVAPAPVHPTVETPPAPATPPATPPAPAPATARARATAAHHTATTLLASLHRDDPRLLLPERVVHHLAPAVTAWLDRGAAAEAVRRSLTAGLPEGPLLHPAGLLAHRLAELLPPPLPTLATARTTPPEHPSPLRNCDGCDRAFRSPEPGHRCRDCRSNPQEAA
ncbi:helix-turn-helix domain-containing protein [Streptomyces sp. NPDC087844]|uniref:helix-turn-helix domain-containing protein n=1 Tax=Streptomyces sp. NPDC087844 TaxID=3365805 RepID=UPI0038176B6A